jgi:phosphoglycolate phosphatase
VSDSTTILFDLDGTLVDTRPGIIGSYWAALRALGHEPDPHIDLTAFIGPPMKDVMGRILRHYGDDRISQAIEAYRADYSAVGIGNSALYDGVRPLLSNLSQAGYRTVVATSKRFLIAEALLVFHGIRPCFEAVYGATADGALDNKRNLIAHILRVERLTPERTVMIGDRRYDVTGARANGVRAVGALWGYGTRRELVEAGADALASRPATVEASLPL